MLAAAVGDRVCVWDPATGEFRKSLAGHARAVAASKWNASGKLLATSAFFDSVRIWDLASDKPVKIVEHSASWALGAWSPAFALAWRWENVCLGIVASSGVGRRSGRPEKRPQVCANHTLGATDLEFSPDGLYLAAFGPEKVNVWNWRGRRSRLPTIRNDRGLARRLCSAALGRARNARAIRVFDVTEGRTAGVFDGHLAEIYSLRPAPTGARGLLPPGRIAPCGCGRWTTARTGPPARTPRGARLSLGELSPDGRTLAAYSWDREQILVFEVGSGKRPRILPLLRGDGAVQSLAWSPDGAILASSSLLPGDGGKGRLILWDVKIRH